MSHNDADNGMSSKPADAADEHDDTRKWSELKPLPEGSRWSHSCCAIDEHRMIIIGGINATWNAVSSGLIYDSRTRQMTPLPNDMPAARAESRAVANAENMYVIGGWGAGSRNAVYRLSLETYEWTVMAPMSTVRYDCAVVLKGDYIYVFGGSGRDGNSLALTERYSIIDNTWQPLPDMAKVRRCHCALVLDNDIYIVGDYRSCFDIFDIVSLSWRTEGNLHDLPEMRDYSAAIVLRDRYLVVIGGQFYTKKGFGHAANCFIYDRIFNRWSSTPMSMDMVTTRFKHTVAVLGEKIIVVGGRGGNFGKPLSSMEFIEAHDLLEYSPLNYPLPHSYFNKILQIVKANGEGCIDDGVNNASPPKRLKHES